MNQKEKIEYIVGKRGGSYTFDDLCLILEILRGEGGCPWDREQTHESIRGSLIEETYEVIEAIDTNDPKLMREELGDVLLQVVFHSQIAAEAGEFDISGVANDICEKLVHRHPHVFGSVKADTSDEVLKNWEVIKSHEKHRDTVTSKLRAIPLALPALMRAQKVGKKADFFDFDSADAVLEKLKEEAAEVSEAAASEDPAAVEEELGDLLLTVTSLARKLGVDSERALSRATDKFIDRFERVEQDAEAMGKHPSELSMPELDAIWDRIKHEKM
ncbi:MAG: nucleoside triphosphate pyrophosphohydrolase [Clostridiales bacterium]|nr:nucleoside triphosphate pyrophosphohydrolase [Clostridiales bacterium]